MTNFRKMGEMPSVILPSIQKCLAKTVRKLEKPVGYYSTENEICLASSLSLFWSLNIQSFNELVGGNDGPVIVPSNAHEDFLSEITGRNSVI